MNEHVINARVAQLVERDLAKVEAAGSSPVSRSGGELRIAVVTAFLSFFYFYEKGTVGYTVG